MKWNAKNYIDKLKDLKGHYQCINILFEAINPISVREGFAPDTLSVVFLLLPLKEIRWWLFDPSYKAISQRNKIRNTSHASRRDLNSFIVNYFFTDMNGICIKQKFNPPFILWEHFKTVSKNFVAQLELNLEGGKIWVLYTA